MSRDAAIKESAVKEKRVWVRLTKRCNNGCLFCLDSDSQDGSMMPTAVVEEQIRKGREEGGQRLVLSGGEATIHPDFLRFLELGRKLGYTWLQTITNGRMFSYAKFAAAALAAGLQEATFSMHGHTPELHDRLVGVPGAFSQSLAGMRNLLGRCVVNVDVVLNRVNIPHLADILEFYLSLGIREFDLLHMVPFGRAWNEHRDELFYDPAEMAPHLKKAFALRRRKGVVLWTNRLPAAFLEGMEDLIQDPHKIHDEVRGRLEMFEAWRDRGVLPVCRDERCGFCPMDAYCEALSRLLAALAAAEYPAVRVRSDQAELLDRLLGQGTVTRATHVVVEDAGGATMDGWLARFAPAFDCIRLEVATAAGALDGLSNPTVASVAVRHVAASDLPGIGSAAAAGAGPRILLPAALGVGPWFEGLDARAARRVGLWLVPREFASECVANDLAPEAASRLATHVGVPLFGLPECLHRDQAAAADADPTRPATVDRAAGLDPTLPAGVDLSVCPDGRLDFSRFTEAFILRYYYVKSLRCAACVRTASCRGLHVNLARSRGLGMLSPLGGAARPGRKKGR